ncbi:hypothetical protein [Companilactobacillus kimchiensis]|uniref:Cell surface SD repeat-containing protein n=1 Tax=Companilactobacillus kimchiensis TaxID=993692 RepID=A0A0R2LHX1_9LACO|nr:hypothetical protein [Companilactobacillus kimchiensis]KRN99445.1 cell surface SD repeat-containing protein [Companilactobacillus kimchiensis]
MTIFEILKKHKLFVLPIIIFCAIILAGFQTEVILAESLDEQNIIHYEPASPHAVKRFGVWTKSGLNINPNAKYTPSVGHEVTIATHFARSVFSTGSFKVAYKWHKKVNDNPWEIDESSNGPNITVKPDEPGIIRYQLELIDGAFFKEHYYSDVATIYASSTDVHAQSIKIQTNTDYIYNIPTGDFENNIAFAKAEPNPEDSTGQVTWSISEPTKASIDKNGQITSAPSHTNDNDNLISSFFVTGTIKNSDGSIITGTKEMNVGGGLFDQKVRAGDKAVFSIQGFEENIDDKINNKEDETADLNVSWHKIDANNKDTLLETKKNSLSFTTENTSLKDNGDKYYAVITMNKQNNFKPLITGQASLTVLPALNPNVTLSDSLQNISFKDENDTALEINNVVNKDQINYDFNLNNNGQKDLHDTVLLTYLPLGTEVTSVTLDGRTLANTKFTTTVDTDDRTMFLTVQIDKLKIGDLKKLTVNTITHDITKKSSFSLTPYFIGTDSDNNVYQSIGPDLKIHYIANEIIPKFKDIQFESIYPFEENVFKYRSQQTNYPNDIISIDDQRRKKTPVKIFLHQPDSLTDNDNRPLGATFKFARDDKSNPETIQDKILIAQSIKGQSMNSVRWTHNQGLLLHIDHKNLLAGSYGTKLNWSIEDSV